MGILRRYHHILNYGIKDVPYKPFKEPPRKKRKYVVPEAIPVTVANMDMRSADFVTAHDLKDYRRTTFNLVLLPRVELSYDIIAREVYGLGEYL